MGNLNATEASSPCPHLHLPCSIWAFVQRTISCKGAAVSPLRWIWERRCPLPSCSRAQCTRTCMHSTCIHGPAHQVLLTWWPAQWCNGKVFPGLSPILPQPPHTSGYTCNCAVNWRSRCVESTESLPGLLPGAKVGMCSLFFLFKL